MTTLNRDHETPLITLIDCSIENRGEIYLPSITWKMNPGEAWLVTGPNGGGKSTFAEALAGQLEITPKGTGIYSNIFSGSTLLVSFEAAAALIEEERARDDSDFVEGGIDPGRTPRQLIAKTQTVFDTEIDLLPEVHLCGILDVLDRGLKYLSTGEIRRTLLCCALISQPDLIIFDEPFGGLDSNSRHAFGSLLEAMTIESLSFMAKTHIILLFDRYDHVPEGVTHILEFSNKGITFSGLRKDYERILSAQSGQTKKSSESQTIQITRELNEARTQSELTLPKTIRTDAKILVDMKNVTVEWSGHKILDNLSWTLQKNEHWLIRGPNGSGKTTFLELITGDNPQVFRNDIWLFGSRRGTGETIWELKEKMGIVSYRLHTEYRALGDLSLENVILSGLHDSIGLYQQCGEEEKKLARNWLGLAGFENQEHKLFRDISYGEQRSVLIARAGVKCPPILILDEPCHGLDESHRNRVLGLLQAIAEGGTSTLLHVTHDPDEVLPCEKHILELCPGENPMYRIYLHA